MSPKRQKILVLSSAFPPHVFGGGEVAAYNMVRLLVSRGHEVHVATMRERDTLPAWGEKQPEGYYLYRLPLPRTHTFYDRSGTSKWKKALWHVQDYCDPRNRRLIRLLLEEVKPDHIDVHNLAGIGFNILPELAKLRAGVTYFLHDLHLACFRGSMNRAGQNCTGRCTPCRAVGDLRQHYLRQVRRLDFVSPSKGNIEILRRFAPVVADAPGAVIRNVPDPLPEALPPKRDGIPRLLFAGRLEPIKGIGFLLEVLAELAQQYAFRLTVLGSGSLEEPLRERYGHEKWLDMRGFVPREQVATAMAEAHLFCMPSLWAEAYGIVTAQALQVGTPVIGSNLGGTVELVRDEVTGLLLPPGDHATWKEAFAYLFTHPEILRKWHENALRHAGEFDAGHIGDAYERFRRSAS